MSLVKLMGHATTAFVSHHGDRLSLLKRMQRCRPILYAFKEQSENAMVSLRNKGLRESKPCIIMQILCPTAEIGECSCDEYNPNE